MDQHSTATGEYNWNRLQPLLRRRLVPSPSVLALRPGFNYWGWATWPAITTWFPWGWSQPVYYNYGSNVYYQDDMVYYGNTPVATADDYADQAAAIAASVPATPPPADSWMPLGVFAVMPDGDATGADPTLFLQLTVSKTGAIAGTLQNTVSGVTKNIEGMVDKETQRAAWTEVGQSRPIMETGIGNLTQDTTPVLVHYADGTTQQWLLVRMEQPPADASGENRLRTRRRAPVPRRRLPSDGEAKVECRELRMKCAGAGRHAEKLRHDAQRLAVAATPLISTGDIDLGRSQNARKPMVHPLGTAPFPRGLEAGSGFSL